MVLRFIEQLKYYLFLKVLNLCVRRWILESKGKKQKKKYKKKFLSW